MRCCLSQSELRRASQLHWRDWPFWAGARLVAGPCYSKREYRRLFASSDTARSFARLLPRQTRKAKLLTPFAFSFPFENEVLVQFSTVSKPKPKG